LQLDSVVQVLVALAEHGVETLGLRHGSGETIENEAAEALLVVVELLLDHADHNVVADQTALVHDLLRLAPEGRLLRNLGAQHVAGGLASCQNTGIATARRCSNTYKVAAGKSLLELGGLGSLASARRADQDHANLLSRGRSAGTALFETLDARLEAGDHILQMLKLILDDAHDAGGTRSIDTASKT